MFPSYSEDILFAEINAFYFQSPNKTVKAYQ